MGQAFQVSGFGDLSQPKHMPAAAAACIVLAAASGAAEDPAKYVETGANSLKAAPEK